MNCLHPIYLKNPRYEALRQSIGWRERLCLNGRQIAEKLKRKYNRPTLESIGLELDSLSVSIDTNKWRKMLELTPEWVVAPCRKCPNCLKKRKFEWRGRLLKEFEYQEMFGSNILMVTLTYSNEYIKTAKETYSRDIAKFFDGLRGKFRRSIRHWCIAELGEKTGRFHVHCILFDAPQELLEWSTSTPFGYKAIATCKNGEKHGFCPHLYKYWPKGLNDTTRVHKQGMTYVTDYVTKQDSKGKYGYFRGAIYCSNGIGIHPESEDFIQIYQKMKSDINLGRYPTFRYGNFEFPIPQYLYNKVVDVFDKMLISYTSSAFALQRGGKFNIQSRYFDNVDDYYNALKSMYGDVYNIQTQLEEQLSDINEFERFKKITHDFIYSRQFLESEGLIYEDYLSDGQYRDCHGNLTPF